MKRQTVAIAINSSWNVVNFRSGLIRGLTEAGYDILVIAPRDEYSERLTALGWRYVPVRMAGRGTSPLQDAGLLLQYLRILRRERPAAFLGYTIKPNIYGSLAARMLGIPVISNIAGLGVTFLKGGALQRLVRFMYRVALGGSRTIFFQNREDRALFVDAGLVDAARTLLLPGSGIDVERFTPGARQPEAGERFGFLLVARLLRTKGIADYVEAARRVQASRPGTRFRIAGILEEDHPDSIARSDLLRWQAEGWIEYLGALDDVRPALAQADAVVLPTFYPEGTPRALLEGAAMGKPLLATDVPGCREIVADGVNGYLCPPRDPRALAEAMERLVDMPAAALTAMGEASRRRATEQYDEKIVVARYLEAIGDATRHAGSPLNPR